MDLVDQLRRDAYAPHFTSVGAANLMVSASDEIVRLRKVEAAARNVADALNGGFIRCKACGDQETTTDVDFAAGLYAALGIEPRST